MVRSINGNFSIVPNIFHISGYHNHFSHFTLPIRYTFFIYTNFPLFPFIFKWNLKTRFVLQFSIYCFREEKISANIQVFSIQKCSIGSWPRQIKNSERYLPQLYNFTKDIENWFSPVRTNFMWNSQNLSTV